eukprot:m.36593 g.36593  ORF g.36593 m.36593 type:complete len:76 (+) comp12870_c0_seq1:275-502(+)
MAAVPFAGVDGRWKYHVSYVPPSDVSVASITALTVRAEHTKTFAPESSTVALYSSSSHASTQFDECHICTQRSPS